MKYELETELKKDEPAILYLVKNGADVFLRVKKNGQDQSILSLNSEGTIRMHNGNLFASMGFQVTTTTAGQIVKVT